MERYLRGLFDRVGYTVRAVPRSPSFLEATDEPLWVSDDGDRVKQFTVRCLLPEVEKCLIALLCSWDSGGSVVGLRRDVAVGMKLCFVGSLDKKSRVLEPRREASQLCSESEQQVRVAMRCTSETTLTSAAVLDAAIDVCHLPLIVRSLPVQCTEGCADPLLTALFERGIRVPGSILRRILVRWTWQQWAVACTPTSTLLHAAVVANMRELLLNLLESGRFRVDAPTANGRTPLHIAVTLGGRIEVLALLLQKGADISADTGAMGKTLLHVAASKGHTNTVKLLIKHGAIVSKTRFCDYQTPLHSAASSGHTEVASVLLDHGAEVDVSGPGIQTPLHYAVENGHAGVAKLLLEHGASMVADATDLHYAAKNGHTEFAKLLIEHGASVNVTDTTGQTPLHYAAWGGHVDAVQLLIKHGADVNATDPLVQTPLHYAAWRGHVDAVQLLIKHGADVNATVTNGQTPLHYAATRGRTNGDTSFAKLLKELGAKVQEPHTNA